MRDHNGQQLAYVYFEDEPGRRSSARAGAIAQAELAQAVFDIGQGTLGVEGFATVAKHLKYALTAPGTRRCNGDWPYGKSNRVGDEP